MRILSAKYRARNPRATHSRLCMYASLVFPLPPAPVSVTKRLAESNSFTSLISRSRPIKVLNGMSRFPVIDCTFEANIADHYRLYRSLHAVYVEAAALCKL